MTLYTRTGDDGQTGLFGGGRVPKHPPRVDAYGGVAELNASLGFALAALDDAPGTDPFAAMLRDLGPELQSRLFDLGADLATPVGSKHEDRIRRLDEAAVRVVESMIDEVDGGNEPMTSFVLPGGSELAGRLHLARTVCRRAERAMVALAETEDVNPNGIIYINRLGDLLFACARRANKMLDVPDVPWVPREPRRDDAAPDAE